MYCCGFFFDVLKQLSGNSEGNLYKEKTQKNKKMIIYNPKFYKNNDFHISGGMKFMNYKNASFGGFMLMSLILSMFLFILFSISNMILINAVGDLKLANSILDWAMENFWYSMLITIGAGVVLNALGYLLFLMKKESKVHGNKDAN